MGCHCKEVLVNYLHGVGGLLGRTFCSATEARHYFGPLAASPSKQDPFNSDGGYHMRIFAIAFIAVMVVLFAGWAEATTFTGTESLPSSTRDYSAVEKAGCGGPGRCPTGLHWVCGPYGGCGCVACGYVRPYVAPHVYVTPRVYVGPRPYYRRW